MTQGRDFFSVKRRRGFSLIEVLVALAIFVMMAIALGATYINILNAYEIAGRAVTRDEDVRFARAALLAEADLTVVERGAEFDGGNGRRVSWKAAVEPTTTADLFKVTFQCELTGPDLPKPEMREETFRVLRPTWSQPADRDKLRADAKMRIEKIQQGLANKR
ncbi:prepilin-type cleavage/methylation domain-containing protein [Nibricoccus aquaticus]|uniref:Prepilin-type cleavage/methylation domain-containing protein n=1 Tax=Nibricoccus aquaticus TaxID=2576891 RepID=A0A290QKZ1_9BACT|nr:prepilin-type cleavage/methylation domain-containing protein [Nibricoccus aquaticus]